MLEVSHSTFSPSWQFGDFWALGVTVPPLFHYLVTIPSPLNLTKQQR